MEEERQILTFDVPSNNIKILRELMKKQFLEIELFAISSANPNRNKSYFTPESMVKSLPTFVDKPILGYFYKDDFASHEGKMITDTDAGYKYWDTTNGEYPLGTIRAKDIVEIIEKDGLQWIHLTAALWTKYNWKAVKRLIKDKTKKVSVEIEVTSAHKDGEILVIDEFELCGITILGKHKDSRTPVLEGIPGAQLSVIDAIDTEYFKQQNQALQFAYQELEGNHDEPDLQINNKEDQGRMEETITNVPEETVVVIEETAIAEETVSPENIDSIDEDQVHFSEEETSNSVDEPIIEENKEEIAVSIEEEDNSTPDLSVNFESGLIDVKGLEAKCIELESKCEEFEAKCREFEELKEKFAVLFTENGIIKTKCEELEGKCAAYNAENDALKAKLFTIECGKRHEEAKLLFATLKVALPEETQTLIYEKCDKGGYETFEALKTEVALAAFDSNFKIGETIFSASVQENPMVAPAVKTEVTKGKTSHEVLKDYVGK